MLKKLTIFIKTKPFLRNIVLAGLLFLLITLIYTFYIFSFIGKGKFLVIWDGPNLLGLQSIYNSGFVRFLDNGGSTNFVWASMHFWNLSFFSILYYLGLSIREVQLIFIFLMSLILIFFSFLGFYKIINHYSNYEHSWFDLFDSLIVTFLYQVSLFNILNINSGMTFSLTYLIYGFLPILFYYVLKLIQKNNLSNREIICLALIFFIVVISVTYVIPIIFAVLVILITQYQASSRYYHRVKLLKLFFSILLTLLFSTYLIFSFIFESKFNNTNFIGEILKTSTGGNIKGGFLYMFLHYFYWALYTDWVPKSLMTFHNYYLNNLYILSIFSLYVVLFLAIIKNKILTKSSLPYIIIILVGLFFGKGPQNPLGGVFTYLTKHLSFFDTVRTPDSKFGIIITSALVILILLVLRFYRNSRSYLVFRVYLLILIIIFSLPLLKGEVILSKDNYPESGSYVTDIPPEYKQVLNIINNDTEMFNVLIYPESTFVINHNRHLFSYQDVLRTQTYKPFLNNAIKNNLSGILSLVYDYYDFEQLKKLNVKYILIRKDDFYARPDLISNFKNHLGEGLASLVASNDFIDLYQVNKNYYTARLYLSENKSNAKIEFVNISPVKYIIKLENIKGQTGLNFLESYNRFFKLYLQPVGSGDFNKAD